MKPTYRKSWAGNLVMWSDLTFGLSFKVKDGSLALVSCFGYNLHPSSDALGLVLFVTNTRLNSWGRTKKGQNSVHCYSLLLMKIKQPLQFYTLSLECLRKDKKCFL